MLNIQPPFFGSFIHVVLSFKRQRVARFGLSADRTPSITVKKEAVIKTQRKKHIFNW